MESFWTDTPFGITLLASLCLSMIAGVVLTVSMIVRARTAPQATTDDTWPLLAVYLVGYIFITIFVTYLAIVVWYVGGLLLSWLGTSGWIGAGIQRAIWPAWQIAALCLWLGTAAWIFRHLFRRWL
jgi:hypothetical protein